MFVLSRALVNGTLIKTDASQELTLADLFHIPFGAVLAKANVDILESGKFPNVTRSVSFPLLHDAECSSIPGGGRTSPLVTPGRRSMQRRRNER